MSAHSPSEASGFHVHDHSDCIQTAIENANAVCLEQGLQLTPIRRRVLEILLEQHKAMGAYDILGALKHEGHAAQPPVAYRALDFLVTHGFAHRVERLNAFVACAHPGREHSAMFLICRGCAAVAEIEGAARVLGDMASASGFALEAAVVEAEGLCPACQS